MFAHSIRDFSERNPGGPRKRKAVRWGGCATESPVLSGSAKGSPTQTVSPGVDLETPTGVAVESTATAARLTLCGAIDLFTAGELCESARACARLGLDVEVDCSSLENLDASALQILLALHRRLQQEGQSRLKMTGLSERVATYLGQAGALTLLDTSQGVEPPPA